MSPATVLDIARSIVKRLLLNRHPWVAVMVVTVAFGTAHAQTSDLTGKWDVVVTTKYSQGKSLLVLEQKAQTLTGYIDGRYGKADLGGTVKGTRFTFTFTLTLEDGKASNVLYEGTVRKNTLTGKVTIPTVIDGTFTATRR
jgi:hypothetical protein